MKPTQKKKNSAKRQETAPKGAYKRRHQPYIDIDTTKTAIPLHVLKRRHS